VAYVHLFNSTTANTTLGTSTSVCVFAIPPGKSLNLDINIGFSTAISVVGLTGFSQAALSAPVPGLLVSAILSSDTF
jgi:hypothetical protein